jgi:hypothetical protein
LRDLVRPGGAFSFERHSVEITKETSETRGLFNGHTIVGPTPVKLSEHFPTVRGVLLRCPGSADENPNVVPVYVGNRQVTADSGPNGGMPILPGTAIQIPCDDPSQLYLVATETNQDVAWIGL